MRIVDKINNLIEISKNYDSIYVKVENNDSIVSITLGNSMSLDLEDLILELNLEIRGHNFMISGFKINSIEDISSDIEDDTLNVTINI